MATPSEGEDVAFVTRSFEREDGEVILLVHKPLPWVPKDDTNPDDPAFRCAYTICFPDGEIARGSAVGIDSMQALLLALAGAQGPMRYKNRGEPRPAPRWLGEDDLGLQVPQFA